MKTINKFLILGAFAFFLQSCEKDEAEPVGSTDEYPVIGFSIDEGSADIPGSVVEEENETQIVYNITMDRPVNRTTTFSARQIGGTADPDDYEISSAVINAYETEGQVVITVLNDRLAEDLETVEFEIGAFGADDMYDMHAENPTFGFEIANYVGPLELSFDWAKEIEVGGTAYPTCGPNVDMDVYLANAEGFDIANPFATAYADYQAATGSCPEAFVMSSEAYPEGTYVFFSDLYANAFYGAGLMEPIPITVTYFQVGISEEPVSFTQNVDEAFHSDSEPYSAETPPYAPSDALAQVTLENGIFTVEPM